MISTTKTTTKFVAHCYTKRGTGDSSLEGSYFEVADFAEKFLDLYPGGVVKIVEYEEWTK